MATDYVVTSTRGGRYEVLKIDEVYRPADGSIAFYVSAKSSDSGERKLIRAFSAFGWESYAPL